MICLSFTLPFDFSFIIIFRMLLLFSYRKFALNQTNNTFYQHLLKTTLNRLFMIRLLVLVSLHL